MRETDFPLVDLFFLTVHHSLHTGNSFFSYISRNNYRANMPVDIKRSGAFEPPSSRLFPRAADYRCSQDPFFVTLMGSGYFCANFKLETGDSRLGLLGS